MSGVDDRIVRMEFNNSAFERGVQVTLSTLDKLKQSLNFSTSKNGLDDLEKTANHLTLGNVGTAVDGVSKKFLALATIGITALANITNRAVNAGMTIAKSLTIDPIKQGFHEYETQLNSVQTILANTQAEGAKIGDVNKALAELNTYSDKTIYNFTEMAKNIGTFTAAGVKLKPATEAIKGIANVAALSGSSSEQASVAMYQLSQAIANNKVGLQDWNSVVNAGMGGRVFQEALFNTAKQMKTISNVPMNMTFDEWTKAGNSFRDSLQDGWITGKVLTQTLSQFTGDLTDAQLKSMGYNDAQIKQIQQQAKTASDAATKVKTFSQLIDTLKEAVGSGWSQSFQTIFGNFEEAKTLWTEASLTINSFVQDSSDARNKILSDWKKLGGRTVLIDSIKKAFASLMSVVQPIKDAFHEIFPSKTGKDLYDLTVRVRDFFKNLRVGSQTSENLKRTFRGLFALLDIGKQIISGIFHVIGMLFGAFSKGSGSILNLTGNVGDFLVSLDEAIKKGGFLTKFFDGLGTVLSLPILLFSSLSEIITGIFSGFKKKDANAVSSSLEKVGSNLSSISETGRKLGEFFAKLREKIQPAVDGVVNAFKNIGHAISESFSNGNFDKILGVVNTGLLAGIALLIRKFLKNGINVDVGGGALESIKNAFDGLTGTMNAMQAQLKANTLLKIAGAIALLTASVVALSFINPERLQSSLTALAVGFGELLVAMNILTKISSSAGFVKVPVIAGSMILLSTAVLILTGAVAALSMLSWEQLAKGLGSVAVLLAVISAATIPLSANSAGMVRAGIGVTAIAVAMNLLYLAVKNFSGLSWGELTKGLSAVSGALVAIAIGMRLMPHGMVLQSAALIGISIALNALYLAVKNFSKLNWKEMGKGLAGVAGSLAAIAIGMQLMPGGMVLQAAGLIGVSVALQLIARALGKMGGMSWEEIGRGLTALAGSLVVLAAGLYLMTGAIAGAAALTIVAAGLSILVPVIKTLSKMSWGSIAKGLGALAAAFAVIGVSGLLLTPVIPALLGLGVALTLVGAGMALFGVGALALATAFGILAGAGTAGVKVLLSALQGFVAMLPTIGLNLALGLTNFITTIGKHAPEIIATFITLLGGLLDAVVKLSPKMAAAIIAVIDALLVAIRAKFPDIVETGLQMLEALLQGISDHIGSVTTKAVDIIVKFLDAIANNIGRIVASGLNLLVKFLQGIANNIGRVITAAANVVIKFVEGISSNASRIVTAGANAIIKFVEGIGKNAERVVSAGVDTIIKFIEGIGKNAVKLANAAADVIIDFINGIADAINDHADDLRKAGMHLAGAIINGMTLGLAEKAGGVIQKAKNIASGIIGGVSGVLHINSPSKDFISIGESIGEGWVKGIDNMSKNVVGAATDVGSETIKTMTKTIRGLSAILSSDMDMTPVVTPVLDLTQFRRDSAQLSALVPSRTVATTSYGQASDISTASQVTQDAVAAQTQANQNGSTIKFEQNNYSPTALSEIDIYRQTKNQLALAKKALGL